MLATILVVLAVLLLTGLLLVQRRRARDARRAPLDALKAAAAAAEKPAEKPAEPARRSPSAHESERRRAAGGS